MFIECVNISFNKTHATSTKMYKTQNKSYYEKETAIVTPDVILSLKRLFHEYLREKYHNNKRSN